MDKANGSIEFLYLARLHSRKRPTVLVKAAVTLAKKLDQPMEVSFVGPDEGEESKVRRHIHDAGSPDWIRVEGPLEPGRTLDRMRKASVYVLPSVDEPFPMSVLEALSVGVPVIVTDSCGLAPFIAESSAGIVTDPSVESLCEAMRRLMEEPGLRESAAKAAVALAREKFSMHEVTNQLEDVYQSLDSHSVDRYSVRRKRSALKRPVTESGEPPQDTDAPREAHGDSTDPDHVVAPLHDQFWKRAHAVGQVPAPGEERTVILNLERGSPLVLQGSAAVIWELIDGTRTETGILKELAGIYTGADERLMAAQTRQFLAGLFLQGLVETSHGPSASLPDQPTDP